MATYIVTTSNWNDPAFWNAISETGPGHTLDFSGLPSNFGVDFWPGSNRILVDDGTTTFTIGDTDFGGSSDAQLAGSTQLDFFTEVIGSQGSDTLDAGVNGTQLDGGLGDDTLTGGGANDTLFGGGGNDSLVGGSGDDNLNGGDGNDEIYGGLGADSIEGGDGDDLLQGEEGNDTYVGGSGSDTINVSDFAGVDQIDGGEAGSDNDELRFLSTTPVAVTFTDLENGSYAYSGGGGASGTFSNIEHFEGTSGQDTLDFSGVTGPLTVTYTDDFDGTITDGTDTISFAGIETMILTDQDDVVDANASWDGVFGDNPGIQIDAGDGNDTIEGGNGADTLEGGLGDDSIIGDYGDDSLIGGDGADTLVGGSGNDTLEGGDGNDSLDGGIEGDSLSGGLGDDTIDGGDGDDTLTGGAGNDTFIYEVGDDDDTITDFNAGNTGALNDGDNTNNDFIDLTGYYDHLSEIFADQADDGILNQSNNGVDGVDYSDNTQFGSGSLTFQGASANSSSFTEENTGVTCFTAGTAIRTPNGDVPIEDLLVGDLVVTVDNGAQPIRWIGKRRLNHMELRGDIRFRPVLIKEGVLGNARALLVSQQHGLMVGRDNLVRAKHLAASMPGIRIANGKRAVTYIHLMFDRHQVIFAEGTPAESFYPGPVSIKTIDAAARAELFALFPNLGANVQSNVLTQNTYGQTARPFLARKNVLHLPQQRQIVPPEPADFSATTGTGMTKNFVAADGLSG